MKIAGDDADAVLPIIADLIAAHNAHDGDDFSGGKATAMDDGHKFATLWFEHSMQNLFTTLVLGKSGADAFMQHLHSDSEHIVAVACLSDRCVAGLVPHYRTDHRSFYGLRASRAFAVMHTNGNVCLFITAPQLGSNLASINTNTDVGGSALPGIEGWIRTFVVLSGGRMAPYHSWESSLLGAVFRTDKVNLIEQHMRESGFLPEGIHVTTPTQEGGKKAGALATAAAAATEAGEATAEQQKMIKSRSKGGSRPRSIQLVLAARKPLLADAALVEALKEFGEPGPRSGPGQAATKDKAKLKKLVYRYTHPAEALKKIQQHAKEQAAWRAKSGKR